MIDDDDPGEGLAQRLDLGDRHLGLGPRRHERVAVAHPPAVILRMRDLDPARTEARRQVRPSVRRG